MDFADFFSEFSAGDARLRMRLSQNFSQPNGDRPVPIGQREATTGYFLKDAEISVVFILYEAECVELTVCNQKKKYFFFSNRLFLKE